MPGGDTPGDRGDDRATLLRHIRDTRLGSARLKDRPAQPGSLSIGAEQAARFRYATTGLNHRGSDRARAAWGGLQDSAPRAGLLSLHARIEGVGPAEWEHSDLIQIWHRRADYIVPAADFGIFTLGALPRDQSVVEALERVADAGLTRLHRGEALPGDGTGPSDAGGEALMLRWAQVTGRFRIRWDASRTTLHPVEVPAIDIEAARLELARRFLGWYGPASAMQFAKWAGVAAEDARTTWNALTSELIAVNLGGRERFTLAADERAVRQAPPARGVRFLPASDPYLYLDSESLSDWAREESVFDALRTHHSSRLVNSLTGRITVDGAIVGGWGRVQHRLTVVFFTTLPAPEKERVMAEAADMKLPIGRDIATTDITLAD